MCAYFSSRIIEYITKGYSKICNTFDVSNQLARLRLTMLRRGYDLQKEHLFHTHFFNTTWHLLNIEHTPTLFMVNKIQNHCSVNPFGHVYSRKSNTTRLHVITDNKLQIICPCLSRLLILHAHNFTIHYLEMPCEMLTSYISHLNCNYGFYFIVVLCHVYLSKCCSNLFSY